MGKFDKRLKGEKEGERRLPGKQRKFAPVADSTGTERTTQTSMVDKMLRERADDVLDVGKAVRTPSLAPASPSASVQRNNQSVLRVLLYWP